MRLAGRLALQFLLLATVARAGELIPVDSLTVSNRVLVRSVIEHPTLRQEYAARQFKGQVPEFEWLLDHLDACSVLAEKAGLLKYRATRREDGRYYADNRDGAAGFILPVLATEGKRAYYVEGHVRGVFSVSGRGVAVIEFRQAKADAIEYTGASFVKVDNVVAAMMAQLFAVFLRGAVDYHYDHVMGHPMQLSSRALNEPKALLEQIAQMPEGDRKLLEPFAALLRTEPSP